MAKYNYSLILMAFNNAYNQIYSGKLKLKHTNYIGMYDKYIEYPSFIGFIRNLVKVRGDYFTSDREIVALMYVVKKAGLTFSKPKKK